MKRKVRKAVVIALSLVLAAGLLAGGFLIYRTKTASANPVEVTLVSNLGYMGYDSEATSYGTIYSDYIQEIYSDASKPVSEVYVAEGETVQTGDPLFAYDPTKLQLELEKARHEVAEVDYEIETAQKKLAKAKTLTPYVEPVYPDPEPEPEPEPLEPGTAELYDYVDADSVPFDGDGTEENPYRYLCTSDVKIDSDFLFKLMNVTAEAVEIPVSVPEESAKEEASAESAEPSDESESSEESEDTPSGEETASAIQIHYTPLYARFEFHEEDNENGLLLGGFALNGKDGFGILEMETEEEEETEETSVSDYVYEVPSETYTQEEITQMIQEAEESLKTLEISKKEAAVALEAAEKNLEDTTVYSKIDGVVRTLLTEEEAQAAGKPFMVISGSDSMFVDGAISETQLGTYQVGDSVLCSSWETGEQYEGTIIEISDEPLSTGSSSSNPNASSYKFTAMIEDPGSLTTGLYVDITMQSTEETESFYLEKAYVRSENGQKYVYALDRDTGLLTRRNITTGQLLWGDAYEILDGLSMDDYIAFPYGKYVKEGAAVKLPEDAEEDISEDIETEILNEDEITVETDKETEEEDAE